MWLVLCVVPFAMLSLLVRYGVETAAGQWALETFAGLLWLAGPPVLLLIDPGEALPTYVVGSVLALSLAFLTIHTAERGAEWATLFGGAATATWFGFGFLVYLAIL